MGVEVVCFFSHESPFRWAFFPCVLSVSESSLTGLVLPTWFFPHPWSQYLWLSLSLVCPAVYIYALDGYIKLNLSQVEVINPLFISFNLLGHCLHEEHCCPLHCWAIVLAIALTLKVPQPCFLRTLPSSCIRSPCFVPCPLPPSCSAQLLLL